MKKIKDTLDDVLVVKDWEINDGRVRIYNPMEVMQNPGQLVGANIHRKTNVITIEAHPEIEEKLTEAIEAAGAEDYFFDPLEQLTRGLSLHEWGHWQGCPMEDLIAMNIAAEIGPMCREYLLEREREKQMREKGEVEDINIKKEPIQALAFQQSNIFTDMIDDTLEAHNEENTDEIKYKDDYILGNWLFYMLEGEKLKIEAPKRCAERKIKAKQTIQTIRNVRDQIEEKQKEIDGIKQKHAPDPRVNSNNPFWELISAQHGLEQLKNQEQLNTDYLQSLKKRRHEIRKRKMDKYFTLFMNVEAKLFLDKEKERFWQEYYDDEFPELEQETRNILKILIDNDELADKIHDRTATKQDVKKMLHELEYKYDKWADKNKRVAEIFMKYMDPDEPPTPPLGLNMFFQGFIDDPELREEMLEKLVGQGKGTELAGDDEVFNAIYRQKAKEIVMEEIKKDRESNVLKVKDLSYKKTIIPSLGGIKWSKTRLKEFGGEQQFEFYKEEVPLEIPGSRKKISKGMPDILFMLDTSGSMGWNYRGHDGTINPDNNMGEYDMVCTTVHSVMNYLEKSKKAPWMKFGALTFSSNTNFSGWQDYKDIKNIYKTLYDKEDGGTQLDPAVVDEVLDTRSDSFWALMVTDGGFWNNEVALKKVDDIVDKGNYFTLIHIGTPNEFTGAIKEKYGEDAVNIIDSPEKLAGLSLKYTKNMYGAA